MSTIKSSDEHLTLNADGSSKDIKFQANGVEKASISSAGVMTATSFAGSGANLTGVSSFNPDGAVTINDSGADVDFRVESDGNPYAIFVEGSTNNVGIGHGEPNKAGFQAGSRVLSIKGAAADDFGVLEILSPDTTGSNRIGEIRFGNLDGGSTYASHAGMRATRDGADNSSALSLWTTNAGSFTEKLHINSSGYVLANKMATSYANLQGPSGNSNHTGSNYNIMRVVENPDSLYNSSNGRFTCPVDGLYFMSAMSINTYSINATIQAIPKKNGAEILGVGRMYENQDHNHGGSAASGVVRCNSGDYLQWDWSGSIYDGPHSSASFALIHGET